MSITSKIRDSSWLRQAFLLPTKDGTALVDDFVRVNSSLSSARFKFANTALGGTLAINPPPQYTHTADRRVPGIHQAQNENGEPVHREQNPTLGRYYSEAIDDNSRIISMRFGVPKFNSLNTFFTGFYNYSASLYARTGRADGAIYTLGRAVGYVVPLIAWPLLVINLGADMLSFFLNKPRSKYYYMKPNMPGYWNAVTSLVNTLAVNKGIVPRIFDDNTKNLLDNRFPFTQQDLLYASSLMGDVIMENGQINIYAMATRYQRLARKYYNYLQDQYNKTQGNGTMYSIAANLLNDRAEMSANMSQAIRNPSFNAYRERWASIKEGKPGVVESGGTNASGSSPNAAPSLDTETAPKDRSDVDGLLEFWAAELDDGSTFVSFRVDNESTVQESFSNQTGDSELAVKINSTSGQARETRFNLAGGVDLGPLSAVAGFAANAVKDFVGGVADSVGMSGLAALGGAAFVDIPKHWTGSNANLPRMNYTFTLTSPYGNKLSQLMFMYVPLCMILAAALPISTGKQSYTSPFLVELYDRGRAQTRLGIIDSLSITRGTTHLGFNSAGSAMGIQVSFSVQDLSSVMHMPLIQGFTSLTGDGVGLFDDDTVFTDYMAILGSLTVNEQTYPLEKLKLRLTKNMSNLRTWFSAAHFANWVTDLGPMQLISAIYPGRVNR